MAKIKKIRFPLEMENGTQARTLEELKENFSLEQVLMYISNGKLVAWLRDRYLDDIAEEMLALSPEDDDYEKKVCEIFEVEYDEQSVVDIESAAEKQRRLSLLKEYTDDEKYYQHLDEIAFEQEEIYDLLDEGTSTIYLCGEKFSIPLAKKNVEYIGINKPTVVVNAKEVVNWDEKQISLINVQFDEKYQEILSKNENNNSQKNKNIGVYCSDTYTNKMLTNDLKLKSEKCYESVKNDLATIDSEESEISLLDYLMNVDFEKIGKNYR